MEKKELVHKIYSEMASNSIKVKTYSKNQIITNFLANRNYIYFVLSGSCSLCSFSSKGELHLLQRYERYDCFGDIFHNIELNNEIYCWGSLPRSRRAANSFSSVPA